MAHTHPNAAAWFEIAVLDMDRAQAFFEALLAALLRHLQHGT